MKLDKRALWMDFLLTLLVRGIAGAVLGALAGLACSPRRMLRALAGWSFHSVAIWIALWAAGGLVVGLFTSPKENRPWLIMRKIRERERRGQRDEGAGVPGIRPVARPRPEFLRRELQGNARASVAAPREDDLSAEAGNPVGEKPDQRIEKALVGVTCVVMGALFTAGAYALVWFLSAFMFASFELTNALIPHLCGVAYVAGALVSVVKTSAEYWTKYPLNTRFSADRLLWIDFGLYRRPLWDNVQPLGPETMASFVKVLALPLLVGPHYLVEDVKELINAGSAE